MERPQPTMHEMPSQERPRERLAQYGEQALSTSELLSITLKTGNKDESAFHLAQRMIATFDGLPGIARASIPELMRLKGIGFAKAVEIKAALEIGRRLLAVQPDERTRITSPADAANLLMAEMMGYEQEHFVAIVLNTRSQVLAMPTIYKGTVNSMTIRTAEVFRPCVQVNASALIIAHNHPSGDPSPSPEDVRTTQTLVKAGQQLDIELLDHLVIGHNRYVSLKERGLGAL
jgi:DNA repair protein RadC